MDLNPQEQAIFNTLQSRQQPQEQPKKKKGNFLTGLIPTATSILGGIAGTIAAPGVGTAAGGAAGGLLGTKLRNMLTGEQDNAKDYLTEGAFGALGGVGKGLKAAKGGIDALRAGEGAGRAANVLRMGAGNTDNGLKLATEAFNRDRSQSLGSNILANVQNQGREQLSQQAGEAQRFNDLAKQNVQHLAQERATQGIPLPGGGILSRPGTPPSFASEGVELKPVPSVPEKIAPKPFPQLQDYLPETSSTPPNPLVQKVKDFGGSLRSDARGVQAGAMQEGTATRLRPSQADTINEYLNGVGAKGNPEKQMRTVETNLGDTGKQIGDLVKSNDRPTTVQELSSIKGSAQQQSSKALGFDSSHPLVVDTEKKLGEAHSLSDLKTLRGSIDTELKGFYSKGERANGAPPTAVERALKGYRNGIDKVLSDAIPGFKEANTAYSTATRAQQVLAKSAKKPNIKIFGLDTGVGSGTPQAAKDAFGRGLQKAGSINPQQTSDSTGAMSIAKGMAKAQIPARMITGNFNSQPDDGQQPTQAPQQPTAADVLGAQQSLGQGGAPSGASGQPKSMYSMDNAAKDIQGDIGKTGGKNVDTIMKVYQFLNPKQTTADKPYGKPSAQQYGLGTSGMQSLDALSNLLQGDPSVLNRATTPGQGLPVIGGLVSRGAGTGEFQALSHNVLDALARARTGAAMTPSETKFYTNEFIPRAGDSAETKQIKLQQLAQAFEPYVSY